MHAIEASIAWGKTMADMDVGPIVIKDMAGLLTPYITGDPVKALKGVLSPDVMVYSHDTAGIANVCQLKTVENDAGRIDTVTSSTT